MINTGYTYSNSEYFQVTIAYKMRSSIKYKFKQIWIYYTFVIYWAIQIIKLLFVKAGLL